MHIIILSGGVGSRLWPVSRDSHPKPFIKLPDGESLLQKVYSRSIHMPGVESITTITNKDLIFKTKKEYDLIEKSSDQQFDCFYVLEPFGRNTAAAIALAAQHITGLFGADSILLVLPSDHIILDTHAFYQAIQEAEQLAQQGRIVTFGIKPHAPETGYGYIEANGHEVIRFVEKPSLSQAQTYLEQGHFLWNSGMFCFSAKTMLEEMENFCPNISTATQRCLEESGFMKNKDAQKLELDPMSFARVPEDSIDYAIMEKTKKSAVIACDIGWSDIGTWTAMHELTTSDAEGNCLKGQIVAHQVKNCYIESDRVIGAIGLENLIVIDTADALLIANKSNAQDVKHVYNQLKNMQHDVHKIHTTVQRPWGTYRVLEEGPGFKVKIIEVEPGASLSLQMHHHRAEHWVIISGQALIRNGDQEFTLEVNQSTSIPIKSQHRLTNPGTTKLVILEVQSGEFLDENDIVRLEDIYGRIAHAV